MNRRAFCRPACRRPPHASAACLWCRPRRIERIDRLGRRCPAVPLGSFSGSCLPAIIVPDVNQIDRRIGSPTKRGDMTMPAGENTLGITGLGHCPDVRAPPRPRRRPREAVPVGRARGSATALKTAFLSVFIIVTLPLTGYWQRDRLAALFVKSTAMQTQRNGQPWLKTAYLVDELAQLGSLAGGQARSSQGLSAPIPQKGDGIRNDLAHRTRDPATIEPQDAHRIRSRQACDRQLGSD